MLSGVGDAAALGKHGIASVHHLPGVGQNLQDHPDFVFGFTSDAPYFAGLSFGGIAPYPQGHRAISARAARADDLEHRRMRRLPEDAARSRRARHPAAFLHGAWSNDHGRKPRWGTGFSCHVCLLRPASRGSVWLQQRRSARSRPRSIRTSSARTATRDHGRGLQDDASGCSIRRRCGRCRRRTCSPQT